MSLQLHRGHYAAAALTLLLLIWMAFGVFTSPAEPSINRPLSLDGGLTRVQVTTLYGEPMQREIELSAQTAANRSVRLAADTRSQVITIHHEQGQTVQQGDVIIELDARDWPMRVRQAEAALKQRQLESRSARELAQKDMANAAQVAQADTLLASAEADLAAARRELANTKIRAPFAGVVDQRHVNVGDWVTEGTPLVTLLDFKPLLITAHIPERDAMNVKAGDLGYAILSNGQRIDVKIRFISAQAHPQTRTFRLEAEAIAPQHQVSGLTATLFIPQPETHAYRLSPALLLLDDRGQLGLKGIDDDHRVLFYPIELLHADHQGIWVQGLGEQANIITIGQGFVEYGEQVEPVFAQAREE